MDSSLDSPQDLIRAAGKRARDLRLALGHRQVDVAAAAGVPLSTLKRFEHTGAVNFDAVARVAVALGAERAFSNLFPPHDPRSLDEILHAHRKRSRARKKT